MILEVLSEDRLEQFKKDIKAAFRFGAYEGMGTDEEVLPEEDLMRRGTKNERGMHHMQSTTCIS